MTTEAEETGLELHVYSWPGSVDVSKLPDSAFADPKGRRYPFKNPDGSVNREGLIAAWTMAMGARSGKKADPEIIAVLEKHRKAMGMGEDKKMISDDGHGARTYATDLTGVEIFSVGTWNGDTYTEGDLDLIVDAYGKMPRQPPLKLGHSEGQKFFGQNDGQPALGWVERVYRSGKKLLADFAKVPDALAGMIRNKNYDRVSAEIYWDYKLANGGVLPRALKAVALLGADMPAVSNLQDLQAALLGENDRIVKAYGAGEPEARTYEFTTKERGSEMTEKEYADKIAALTTDLGAAKEETKAATTRADAAEKVATESALKVFSLELDGLVRQGKVLPAEVDGYKADFLAMGTSPRKYTEGGKGIEKTWGQKKLEELSARPKLVEFKEKAEGGDGGAKGGAGQSVHELTEKVMRERKCTYQEAQESVRADHPEMFRAYITRKEGSK